MKKHTPIMLSAAIAAAGVVVFAGGCSGGNTHEVVWHDNGQPEFVSSHDTWWSYQFVYHPYADVFYEPYTHTYVWPTEEGWDSGDSLPNHIELDHDTAQVVFLQQQDPVVQHAYAKHTTWLVWDPPRGNPNAPRSYGY